MASATPAPPPSPRRGVAAVFVRELGRIAHTPFYLMFVIILPLASFAVLTAIFRSEIPRDMPVLVCDNDGSNLARELIRRINASATMQVIEQVTDMDEAEHIIREGRAYALFYLPKDLERNVLRGAAPAVTVYYNNQWLLTSGVISRAAREVVVSLSIEYDLYARLAAGESPASARKRVEPIRLDSHPLFNPNMNYQYYLLPMVLPTIMQVFITIVMVHAVGREFRSQTAGDWFNTAGQRVWTAVLGKTLPYTLAFLVITVFMWVWLARFCGVPVRGNWPALLGATVLFVLAYQSMGCLIVSLSGNLRSANSAAGFYTGPAFAVSGITFPTVGMPLAAKIWSGALPLSYYLRIVQQQTLKEAPIEVSLRPMLVLCLFLLIPLPLTLYRIGRLFRSPEKWGQS